MYLRTLLRSSRPIFELGNVIGSKIKLKQSNFERNAKKMLGFEYVSLQVRNIEKNCLLMIDYEGFFYYFIQMSRGWLFESRLGLSQ
jgi:hypothetical protein